MTAASAEESTVIAPTPHHADGDTDLLAHIAFWKQKAEAMTAARDDAIALGQELQAEKRSAELEALHLTEHLTSIANQLALILVTAKEPGTKQQLSMVQAALKRALKGR